MSVPLGLVLNPQINKVLDKRCSGVSTNRPQYVAPGLLRFETDTQKFVYYNGNAWVDFSPALFEEENDTDYVQNPIGSITEGTTIADLKAFTLSQLFVYSQSRVTFMLNWRVKHLIEEFIQWHIPIWKNFEAFPTSSACRPKAIK